MEELGFIDVSYLSVPEFTDDNFIIASKPLFKPKTSPVCKCGKYASFGPPDTKQKITCKACKRPEYINVSRQSCECGKTASWGPPDTRKRISCTKCRLPEYINLVSIACKCGKFASFGYPGTKRRLTCGKCKLPNFVNLSSRTTLFRKRLERHIPQ